MSIPSLLHEAVLPLLPPPLTSNIYDLSPLPATLTDSDPAITHPPIHLTAQSYIINTILCKIEKDPTQSHSKDYSSIFLTYLASLHKKNFPPSTPNPFEPIIPPTPQAPLIRRMETDLLEKIPSDLLFDLQETIKLPPTNFLSAGAPSQNYLMRSALLELSMILQSLFFFKSQWFQLTYNTLKDKEKTKSAVSLSYLKLPPYLLKPLIATWSTRAKTNLLQLFCEMDFPTEEINSFICKTQFMFNDIIHNLQDPVLDFLEKNSPDEHLVLSLKLYIKHKTHIEQFLQRLEDLSEYTQSVLPSLRKKIEENHHLVMAITTATQELQTILEQPYTSLFAIKKDLISFLQEYSKTPPKILVGKIVKSPYQECLTIKNRQHSQNFLDALTLIEETFSIPYSYLKEGLTRVLEALKKTEKILTERFSSFSLTSTSPLHENPSEESAASMDPEEEPAKIVEKKTVLEKKEDQNLFLDNFCSLFSKNIEPQARQLLQLYPKLFQENSPKKAFDILEIFINANHFLETLLDSLLEESSPRGSPRIEKSHDLLNTLFRCHLSNKVFPFSKKWLEDLEFFSKFEIMSRNPSRINSKPILASKTDQESFLSLILKATQDPSELELLSDLAKEKFHNCFSLAADLLKILYPLNKNFQKIKILLPQLKEMTLPIFPIEKIPFSISPKLEEIFFLLEAHFSSEVIAYCAETKNLFFLFERIKNHLSCLEEPHLYAYQLTHLVQMSRLFIEKLLYLKAQNEGLWIDHKIVGKNFIKLFELTHLNYDLLTEEEKNFLSSSAEMRYLARYEPKKAPKRLSPRPKSPTKMEEKEKFIPKKSDDKILSRIENEIDIFHSLINHIIA